MINLLLSAAAFALAIILARVAGFSIWAGLLPGFIAFTGTFFLLGRRVFTKIQNGMGEVQKELSTLNQNPREQKVKMEKSIKILESLLPLKSWQFLVEAEVMGQIGIIKFMFKDVPGAEAAFAKASSRNWLAQAMGASIAYQKKDFGLMTAKWEEAVKHGKKEGMLWAGYAWCLLQNKEKDKALKVMARAVEANPSDEKLKGALTALQNDKRLKMKAWEPGWWQLSLESPPAPQPMFVGGGGRRRFR
ncbi:MAG: tetratricopeptide repeat protein [Myxococcaceae bacterium]